MMEDSFSRTDLVVQVLPDSYGPFGLCFQLFIEMVYVLLGFFANCIVSRDLI